LVHVLRNLKNQKGQSVTEFAVILPVFILLVTGVLVIGSVIYAKTIVVLASSQGARVGGAIYNDNTLTIEEKNTKVKNTALTIVSNALVGEDREVNITHSGNEIEVEVIYEYHIPVGLISTIFGKETMEIKHSSSYLIL
jgi:Flp pilus assembly protein TadG